MATAQGLPPTLVPPPAGRILVMPFESAAPDRRIVWLGEASAVLLADDLNALGSSAIAREERQRAFERLQVPRTARLTDATVIRIGQLVGAGEVVVGSLDLVADTLTVQVRSITLETARMRTVAVERGPVSDLFAIFERVARQVAPGSTMSSDEIQRHHPPLAGFEDYIKGLLAETPATQAMYLNAALKLQPTFDRARLALWNAYTDDDEHARALAAVRAVPSDSPVARQARFFEGLSLLLLNRLDDAFGVFKAAADVRPDAAVLNNLGVVQLRRGRAGDRATDFFASAVKADPDDSDYFFNLGYAWLRQRDPQAAIHWLREAVRRSPSDGEAHYLLGLALSATGSVTESAREKELARRLSSAYEQADKPVDAVPRGLERLKHDAELPRAARVEATLATAEQRDQQELAAFYLDHGRRLIGQNNDRAALVELQRALYLSPYDADAHLLVGRIQLRAGLIREAIDAFKIAVWSRESADAHVALAEAYALAKEPDLAREEAGRALALAPSLDAAKRVLEQVGPKP